MTIICFFGPDGSGKTSLAERTAEHLSGKGFNIKYSWMRGSHTLTSVISKMLSRFDYFKGEDNPYYSIRIPRKLSRLWQSLECVSVVPVIVSRYLLPQLMGYTVVADRYSVDFVVWVAMTTNDEEFPKGFVAKCASRLADERTMMIFVTARPEVLAQRSDMEEELLEKQIELYRSAIENNGLNVHTIETSETSIEDSFKEVMSIINGGLA